MSGIIYGTTALTKNAKTKILDDLGDEPLINESFTRTNPPDVDYERETTSQTLQLIQELDALERNQQVTVLDKMVKTLSTHPIIFTEDGIKPLLDLETTDSVRTLIDNRRDLVVKNNDKETTRKLEEWILSPETRMQIIETYLIERRHSALKTQVASLMCRVRGAAPNIAYDTAQSVRNTRLMTCAFDRLDERRRVDVLKDLMGTLRSEDEVFTQPLALDMVVSSLIVDGMDAPDELKFSQWIIQDDTWDSLESVTDWQALDLMTQYDSMVNSADVDDDKVNDWLLRNQWNIIEAVMTQWSFFGVSRVAVLDSGDDRFGVVGDMINEESRREASESTKGLRFDAGSADEDLVYDDEMF